MASGPDPEECAHEYGATRERIAEVVAGADPDAAVPACPGWRVGDVLAHLAGVPAALVAGDVPRGDTQGWVDAQVEARRGRSTESLLDEWAQVSPDFERMMATSGPRIAGLIYDVVAHEHDLRAALGVPGARGARAVVVAMDVERSILAADLGRSGGAVVARSSAGEWRAGESVEGTAPVELDLSASDQGTWELLRALGSRRSARQLDALPWRGDWRSIEAGLFHMPLPADDLVE